MTSDSKTLSARLVSVLTASVLSACSAGSSTDPGSPINPLATSQPASADVAASMGIGSTNRREPTQWSPAPNTPTGGYNYGWGLSASAVYFGGPALGAVTSNTTGVWTSQDIGTSAASAGVKPGIFRTFGFGPRDIYAVGGVFLPGTGIVQQFDGTSWSAMSPAPQAANWFGDIWGPNRRDLYVVGDFGVIEHYDGTAWTYMSSGTTNRLVALWGQDKQCLFAAGYGGTILQLRRGAWEAMDVPTPNTGDLNQISMLWGTSCWDVWAAPRDAAPGNLLHYNGRRWQLVSVGVPGRMFGVYGTSADNVVAVGSGGTIVHFDGRRWEQMQSGTTEDLIGVWAAAPSRFFVSVLGGNGGVLQSR